MIANSVAVGNFNGMFSTFQAKHLNPPGMTSTLFWESPSAVVQTSASINGKEQAGSQGYLTATSSSVPGILEVNASQATPSISGQQGLFNAQFKAALMTMVGSADVETKPGMHPTIEAMLPPAQFIPMTFEQAAAPVTKPASGSQVPPYAFLLPPLSSTTTLKGTVPLFSNPSTAPFMNLTGILVDGAPINYTGLATDQLYAFSVCVPAGKTVSFLMDVSYPKRAGNVQGSLVVEPL